jgi:hypothetical protein
MPVPADRLSLYDNAVLPFQLFRMGEIPSGGNETLMSVELGMGYF